MAQAHRRLGRLHNRHLRQLINSTDRSAAYDKNVMNIVSEELQSFFSGAKSAEDTARLIQDRVGIYVNEQR